MKRIISLVLTFAMMFTTFGPSVYATGEGIADIISDETPVAEQIEQSEQPEQTEENIIDGTTDQVATIGAVEPDEGETTKGSVVYKLNDESEKAYIAGSTVNVTADDSLVVWVEADDGTTVINATSREILKNDIGVNNGLNDGKLVLSFDSKQWDSGMTYHYYTALLDCVDGEQYSFEFCVITDSSEADGVYYSTDGVNFEKSNGSDMGIASDKPLYFYVVDGGQRIAVTASGAECFAFTYGDSGNNYVNSLTMTNADPDSSYIVTIVNGDGSKNWQDLQLYAQETGFSDIYIVAGGVNKYNAATGISVMHGFEFDLQFRDSKGNNIPKDKIVVGEENKIYLLEKGIRVNESDIGVHFKVEDFAQEGEQTVAIMVNGEQAAIRVIVGGGGDGAPTSSYTPVYLTGPDDKLEAAIKDVHVSEQGSYVGITFKDANGNYVPAGAVYWVNSDSVPDVSYDKRTGTLEDGTSVSFYNISFGMNTPAQQYTLQFAIGEETVYAYVNVNEKQNSGGNSGGDVYTPVAIKNTSDGYVSESVDVFYVTQGGRLNIAVKDIYGNYIDMGALYWANSDNGPNASYSKYQSTLNNGTTVGYYGIDVSTEAAAGRYTFKFEINGNTTIDIPVVVEERLDNGVYYKVDSGDWTKYAGTEYAYFETTNSIVQVKVVKDGEMVAVNETSFGFGGIGYIKSDADGLIQTMYITPDDYREYGSNTHSLVLKNTVDNPGEWSLEFALIQATAEIYYADNYNFSYALRVDSANRYVTLDNGEELVLEPGERAYLKLNDHNIGKTVKPVETAYFNTAESNDDINVTYSARGNSWCIDAGREFEGEEEITFISDGIVYGPVKVIVTEDAAAYRVKTYALYGPEDEIEASEANYVEIQPGWNLKLAFGDNNGFIDTDNILLNNKEALNEAGFHIEQYGQGQTEDGESVTFFTFWPTESLPFGEYTAEFTLGGNYNGVEKTFKIVYEEENHDAYYFEYAPMYKVPANGTYTVNIIDGCTGREVIGYEVKVGATGYDYESDSNYFIPFEDAYTVNEENGVPKSLTIDGSIIEEYYEDYLYDGSRFEVYIYTKFADSESYYGVGKTFHMTGLKTTFITFDSWHMYGEAGRDEAYLLLKGGEMEDGDEPFDEMWLYAWDRNWNRCEIVNIIGYDPMNIPQGQFNKEYGDETWSIRAVPVFPNGNKPALGRHEYEIWVKAGTDENGNDIIEKHNFAVNLVKVDLSKLDVEVAGIHETLCFDYESITPASVIARAGDTLTISAYDDRQLYVAEKGDFTGFDDRGIGLEMWQWSRFPGGLEIQLTIPEGLAPGTYPVTLKFGEYNYEFNIKVAQTDFENIIVDIDSYFNFTTHPETVEYPVDVIAGEELKITARDANGLVIVDKADFRGYTLPAKLAGSKVEFIEQDYYGDPAGYVLTIKEDAEPGVYPVTVKFGNDETEEEYTFYINVIEKSVWFEYQINDGEWKEYTGERFDVTALDVLRIKMLDKDGNKINATDIGNLFAGTAFAEYDIEDGMYVLYFTDFYDDVGHTNIWITEGENGYLLKYNHSGYKGEQFTGKKVTVRQQDGAEVVYDFDVYNKENPMEVTVGENLFVAFYNKAGQKFMRAADGRPIIELFDQWKHNENGLGFWQIEKEFQVMAYSRAAVSVKDGVHKLVFTMEHNGTQETATLYFKAVLPKYEFPTEAPYYTGHIVTRDECYEENEDGESVFDRYEYRSFANESTVKVESGREFNLMFGTMKNGAISNPVEASKIKVVQADPEVFDFYRTTANILRVRYDYNNVLRMGDKDTLVLLVDGKRVDISFEKADHEEIVGAFTGNKITLRKQDTTAEVVYDFNKYNAENPMEVTVGENFFISFYNDFGKKFMYEQAKNEDGEPAFDEETGEPLNHYFVTFGEYTEELEEKGLWQSYAGNEVQVQAYNTAAYGDNVHKLVYTIWTGNQSQQAELYIKAVLPTVDVAGKADYTGKVVLKQSEWNWDEATGKDVETVYYTEVDNNTKLYMSPDRMMNFQFGTFDRNGKFTPVDSKYIQVADVNPDILKYIKFPGTASEGMTDTVMVMFTEGENTSVPLDNSSPFRVLVNGKLVDLEITADTDNGEFTGKIFIRDENGQEKLYYSYFDNNGNVIENYKDRFVNCVCYCSEEDKATEEHSINGCRSFPVTAGENFTIIFRDLNGDDMLANGKVPFEFAAYTDEDGNVVHYCDEYLAGIGIETEWTEDGLLVKVPTNAEGHNSIDLVQKNKNVGNGGAWFGVEFYAEFEEVEMPDDISEFDGVVYSVDAGKETVYSNDNYNFVTINAGEDLGIRFKKVVNGKEIAVPSKNVKVVTDYNRYIFGTSADNDVNGEFTKIAAYEYGDSGIYQLIFLVDEDSNPATPAEYYTVNVAYDLTKTDENGDMYGLWHMGFGYERYYDEDGVEHTSYEPVGIRYSYNAENAELDIWVSGNELKKTNVELPKAALDATFKNVKSNIKCIEMSGVKSIENLALKAFSNVEVLEIYPIYIEIPVDEPDEYGYVLNKTEIRGLEIAEKEFAGLKKLAYVYADYTDIGKEAFSGCTNLKHVSLRGGFENDEYNVFEKDHSYIGDNAFLNCKNIEKLYLDGKFVSGATPFKGCTKLTTMGASGLGEFDITYSGYYDKDRDETVIPANIFAGTSLKSANLYGVNRVESGAFKGCTALNTVSFDWSIETIEDSAFSGCNAIKTVNYAGRMEDWYNNVTIGADNGNLAKVIINPEYIYVVDSGNFGDIIGATPDEYDVYEFEVDDNVIWTLYSDGTLVISGEGATTDITDELAEECDGRYRHPLSVIDQAVVDTIIVEDGVTKIGARAFEYYLHNVRGVTIADSVKAISNEALSGLNESLEVINIPTDVELDGFYGIYEGSAQIRYNGDGTPENYNFEVNLSPVANISVVDVVNGEEVITGISEPYAPAQTIELRLRNAREEFIDPDYGYAYTEYMPTGKLRIDGEEIETEFVQIKEGKTVVDEYYSAKIIVGNFDPETTTLYIDAEYVMDGTKLSGKTGKVDWTYTEGILILSGNGATANYKAPFGSATMPKLSECAPWMNLNIHTVIVKEGVTGIGNANFLPGWYGKIELPSTLKTIGEWNFVAAAMEEIVFPENLTSIGANSFNEANIDRIVFNDKLTTIGGETFQNMYSCTEGEYIDIVIPASVTSIGDGAFTNGGYEQQMYGYDDNGEMVPTYKEVSALRSITVDSANPYFKVENGALVTMDGRTLIALPAAAKVHNGQYVHHDNWNDEAYTEGFNGVYTVPYGVETLTYRAFSGHNTLTAINLPDTLVTVGDRAFSDLEGVETIILPDSVKTIGNYAFEDVVLDTQSDYNPAGKLEKVVLSKNITKLPNTVFAGCAALKEVVLPENLAKLEENTFVDCTNLEKVYIGAKLTSLGSNLSWLNNVDVSNITVSEDNKTIKVQDGMLIVGTKLVKASENLDGVVVVPNGVKEIADYAFQNAWKITGIQLPDGLTTIGVRAFEECSNLENIIVPSSVKSIGAWAFSTNYWGMITEPGDYTLNIWYKGTEANWNKLINNKFVYGAIEGLEKPDGSLIYEVHEYNPTTEFRIVDNGTDKAVTKALTANAKVNLYTEEVLVGTYVPYGTVTPANPLFGEENGTIALNVYSKDEDVAEVRVITERDGEQLDRPEYEIWATGAGTAEVVFESVDKPALKYTVKATVTQMSTAPQLTITNAKVNANGEYIVVPSTGNQSVKSAITWDAAKWTNNAKDAIGISGIRYELAIDEVYSGWFVNETDEDGNEIKNSSLLPIPTVNASGVITLPKFTKAQLEMLAEGLAQTIPMTLKVYLEVYATEVNEKGQTVVAKDQDGNPVVVPGYSFASEEINLAIYPQKVSNIVLSAQSEFDMEVDAGEFTIPLANNQTIILDAHDGDTIYNIKATAENRGLALEEFEFTASSNDIFELTQTEDQKAKNEATVKLIDGGAGSMKVTIKSVDGAKTAALNFKAGVKVNSLDISTTAPVVENDGDDIYGLAVGKNTTIKADVAPSNATTKAIKWSVEVFNADEFVDIDEYAYETFEEYEAAYDKAVAAIEKYITVSNGKVTVNGKAPAGLYFAVKAETTDGTYLENYLVFVTTSLATHVHLGVADEWSEALLDGEWCDKALDEKGKLTEIMPTGDSRELGESEYTSGRYTATLVAIPVVKTQDVKEGKTVVETYCEASDMAEVTWSVSGGIAKYVTLTPKAAVMDGAGEISVPAMVDFTVDGPRSGEFTIKATAADGSGKSDTYKIKLTNGVFAMDIAAPNGIGVKTDVNGDETWTIAANGTIKPTVTFNNGDSLAKPTAATYSIKATLNADEQTVYGNDEKSATSLKIPKAGIYTLKVASLANPAEVEEVTLRVTAANEVYLGTLDMELPAAINYDEANGVYTVAKGTKAELVQYLNGIKTTSTKAVKAWFADGEENNGKTAPFSTSGNKHYFTVPKDAEAGTIYTIRCEYRDPVKASDIYEPQDTISAEIKIKVVDKPTDIRLVKDDVQIHEMKNYLKPDVGTLTFTVTAENDGANCADYTVTSSNAKLLKIEKVNGTTFDVTPLGVGKVNVTITANDGSNTKMTYSGAKAVQIGKVDSPVTAIKADGTSFYIEPGQTAKVGINLEATKAPATMTAMEWTSSNNDIVDAADIRCNVTDATEPYKTTGSGAKLVEYYSSAGAVEFTAIKAGKVTLTGKALDGSNKTVKITVNVAANTATTSFDINVPTGTANGGVPGQAVLAWGKSIKLNQLFNATAKNKTVVWTVEAAEKVGNTFVTTSEAVDGITVKNGTVTAANPTKAVPTPYSGWIKVTATLNYQLYNATEGVFEYMSDTQYIYVVQPVTKISLAQIAVSKGKYSTKEVSAITAKPGQTIDLKAAPYTFTTTYKTYSNLTAESEQITDLVWTTNNSSIATVSQDGVVTIGSKKGTVTIKAMAQDGTKVAKSIKITIK